MPNDSLDTTAIGGVTFRSGVWNRECFAERRRSRSRSEHGVGRPDSCDRASEQAGLAVVAEESACMDIALNMSLLF